MGPSLLFTIFLSVLTTATISLGDDGGGFLPHTRTVLIASSLSSDTAGEYEILGSRKIRNSLDPQAAWDGPSPKSEWDDPTPAAALDGPITIPTWGGVKIYQPTLTINISSTAARDSTLQPTSSSTKLDVDLGDTCSDSYEKRLQQYVDNIKRLSGASPVFDLMRIAVNFHIVAKNSTSMRDIDRPLLDRQMAQLNTDFHPSNISFILRNITRTVNPIWAEGNYYNGEGVDHEMKRALHQGSWDTINVFIFDNIHIDKVLAGYSTLFCRVKSLQSVDDGIALSALTLPGRTCTEPHTQYMSTCLGRTLVHEIGHWLGLGEANIYACDGTPQDKFSWECTYMSYDREEWQSHFNLVQQKTMHDTYRERQRLANEEWLIGEVFGATE